MEIKKGDIFKSSWDGEIYSIKAISNKMVVLQSQDGNRQILTEADTLKIKSFYQRKEGAEK